MKSDSVCVSGSEKAFGPGLTCICRHIACADHFATPDKQKQVHEGLDDHPKVTLHDYPGADHGFATETGKRRNDAAAELADGRTEAFFADHIG